MIPNNCMSRPLNPLLLGFVLNRTLQRFFVKPGLRYRCFPAATKLLAFFSVADSLCTIRDYTSMISGNKMDKILKFWVSPLQFQSIDCNTIWFFRSLLAFPFDRPYLS